jgi:hypothetical protein
MRTAFAAEGEAVVEKGLDAVETTCARNYLAALIMILPQAGFGSGS